MPKKITKKEMNKILKELKVDFQPNGGCLHIFLIKYFFWDEQIKIKQGLNEYEFINFYEVMLWYNYFICKKHRIHRFLFDVDYSKTGYYYTNKSYFARVPKSYRNLSPKHGLIIIKQALEHFLIRHNGIPYYFNQKVFDNTVCKIVD